MSRCSTNLGIIKEFILQRNHMNVKNVSDTFKHRVIPIGDKHYTCEKNVTNTILPSLLVLSNIKEFIYERNHRSVKNVLMSLDLLKMGKPHNSY